MDAVHVEGDSQTLYSNVYDLTHRRVHVYHFHDYQHSVVFDLTEKLAKGAHSYDLPALFPPNPAAETWAAEPMSRYWQVVDGRRATGSYLPELGVYEGDYAMPPEWAPAGAAAVVSAGDEYLLLELPDAGRYELYPETDTRFFYVAFRGPNPTTIFEVGFETDEAGRVVSMMIELGGDEVVFPRIGVPESTEENVPSTTTTSIATTSTASMPTTSTIPVASTTSTASLPPSASNAESGVPWLWLWAPAAVATAGLGWLALRRSRPGR